MELKCFDVCDATGQTALSVWYRLISTVQLGQCYAFWSLTTRKDGSRTVLTTTPSTLVTAPTVVGQPSSLRLVTVTAEEILCGPATGVKIVAKPRCPRCHAGQDQLAIKCSTHRCERCSMLQRTPAYLVTYSGVLIVAPRDVNERSMALTNSAVMGFVREFCVVCNAHDGPALETIMALPELVVFEMQKDWSCASLRLLSYARLWSNAPRATFRTRRRLRRRTQGTLQDRDIKRMLRLWKICGRN